MSTDSKLIKKTTLSSTMLSDPIPLNCCSSLIHTFESHECRKNEALASASIETPIKGIQIQNRRTAVCSYLEGGNESWRILHSVSRFIWFLFSLCAVFEMVFIIHDYEGFVYEWQLVCKDTLSERYKYIHYMQINPLNRDEGYFLVFWLFQPNLDNCPLGK